MKKNLFKIKICGIRSVNDALSALEAGADAIGLLVGQTHPSPDFISTEAAAEIVIAVGKQKNVVLVTHETEPQKICDLVQKTNVNALQLHGYMSPEQVKQTREKIQNVIIMKALHVDEVGRCEDFVPFLSWVDAFIADSCNSLTGQVGGTGLTHDWTLTRKIIENSPLPVFLAGGLRPENIAEAVMMTRPWGVDVNSGVKNKDGYKDFNRLQNFIKTAKECL